MHISGKILVGLVVLGGIAAIFLSAKTLGIRNEWMKVAQKNEAEFNANQEQIAVKTRELENKRAELARTMIGWDRYWPQAEATIRQGVLGLNLGTSVGIKPDVQTLWVFAINEDGTSRYVGDFRVTRASETACEARPNWLLRAGDLTDGRMMVRVRSMIPNQFQTRLAALDQQMLAASQSVLTNEAELARQGEIGQQTDKLIASRLTEINGDPQLEGKPLPDVNIKGLIAAMADEEEARNAALLEADRLLRALKDARERFEETLRANRQLTESLPQPGPGETTIGAAGR